MKIIRLVAIVLLSLTACISIFHRPEFVGTCRESFMARLDPQYVQKAVERYDWTAINLPLLLAIGLLILERLDQRPDGKPR